MEYLFEYSHKWILKNNRPMHHYYDVYLIQTEIDVTKLTLQPEEVAEVKMINFRELKNLITTKKIDMVDHHEEYAKLFEVLEKRFKASS